MLESWLLDVQAILAGEHVHKLEQSLSARVLNTFFLRSFVGECDLSVGNGRSGGIQNRSINGAVGALTIKGIRIRDDQNRREKERPQLARRHTHPHTTFFGTAEV